MPALTKQRTKKGARYDWQLNAARRVCRGRREHLELHLNNEKRCQQGQPERGARLLREDAGLLPDLEAEQALDILRSTATVLPDRVKTYSFRGSGGGYARLFDDTQEALSWDNILWINRTVSVP